MANNDKPATETVEAAPKVVTVPKMTADQLDFLRSINLKPADYDRTIVVGGPARARPITA